jgi:hypothetical protein
MKTILRLRSKRAPYIRAGVRFESNRKPVDLDESAVQAIGLDGLRRVHADPAITAQIVQVGDDGAETVVATLDKSKPWPDEEAPPFLPSASPETAAQAGAAAAPKAKAAGKATAPKASADTPPANQGAGGDAAGAAAPAAEPAAPAEAEVEEPAPGGATAAEAKAG